MALFVDLGDDDSEPPQDFQAGKPVWNAPAGSHNAAPQPVKDKDYSADRPRREEEQHERAGKVQAADFEPDITENANRNSMTEALGCYPIIVAIAASLDQNSLDNLSRTCRQVRANLLQYRKVLLLSTLRCTNEGVPVDPEETLRYRARAGNWYYMEDTGRTSYNGKSGSCARDMVSECRRCGTVVCRNCAIKPPAPIVLRDRHRRLCKTCTRVPIGALVKPPLPPTIPLSSEIMQSKICRCATDGVWLCQPCGRSIRGADHDYQAIWKWRGQYGEVLGGLGTGIGEGDRGVPCGREEQCHGAKDREHETDCDAADAAADDYFFRHQQQQQTVSPPSSPPHNVLNPHNGPGGSNGPHGHHNHHFNPNHNHHHDHHPNHGHPAHHTPQAHHFHHISPATWATGQSASTVSGSSSTTLATAPTTHAGLSIGLAPGTPDSLHSSRRHTPSPGYARHEIEGIGGVVKTKLVRMVKVGACVPEWEDEISRGEILGREVSGKVRSWCGWCWRAVPGKKDIEKE